MNRKSATDLSNKLLIKNLIVEEIIEHPSIEDFTSCILSEMN